jgi:hypothetical protein
VGLAAAEAEASAGQRSGKKTSFCAIYAKMIILPRQARDKHREKHSKKSDAFSHL